MKLTNKDKVMKIWEEFEWPPKLGDKVRVFVPAHWRGLKAKVIAVGEHKDPTSSRFAPDGKVRVGMKRDGDYHQWSAEKADLLPGDCKISDLNKF